MSSTVLTPIIQYNRFVWDDANRDVLPSRVENLAEGIESLNLLDLYPGVMTGEWKILDGQTRIAASRGMGRPSYMIVANGVTIEDMAEANANTIRYSPEDALAVYMKMGFSAYKKVAQFLEEHSHLSLGDARKLLNGGANGQMFSDGQYAVTWPNYAEVVSGYIEDFMGVHKWVKTSAAYKAALANLAHNPDYDHKRMMERLKERPVRLLKCGKVDEAFSVLFDEKEGVYNFNKAVYNRVELKTIPASRIRGSHYDKADDVVRDDFDPPVRVIAPAHEVVIHCTGDLSRFTVHPSARPVNERRLQRLIEFMGRRNLLPYYPIIVDRNLVVYDGQRRLAAARKLGLPIYYIVASNINMWMVALASGRSSSWGDKDYLKHFHVLGYKEYAYLDSFRKKYPFISLSRSIFFLDNRDYNRVLFRSGRFRAECRDKTEKMASQLARVAEGHKHIQKHPTFQQEVFALMDDPVFFVTRFVDKLNNYPHPFGLFGDAQSCRERIMEVYNYKP